MRKLNNNKICVSIIVPTYRRTHTLSRALESITNQSYKNIEVIIIDDNADMSWNEKVIKIYNNFKSQVDITLISNEENLGSAISRNLGIEKSKGHYVTFLDDDDYYLEDKVKNQLYFMRSKNLDYSITDLSLFNEKNELVEIRNRNYLITSKERPLIKHHIMYHMTGTNTFMFKRDYLIKIGMFTAIDIGDEFYLMSKAIKAEGKFGYLAKNDVVAYVHTETGGLSSGIRKIIGEKKLYKYKTQYKHMFSLREKRYMLMRHNMVLAYTYLRMKRCFKAIYYSFKSFLISPIRMIKLIINRK